MSQVSFDDLLRLQIQVGRIIRAEPSPKATQPAYKLWIDFGEEGVKKSSARITALYSPQDLVGRLPGRAEALSAKGATGVVCDVYDAARLQEILKDLRPEIVINELTDLPQVMDRSRLAEFYANNDRVRTVGGDNLLDAAIRAGARRYLVESVAFFYAREGEDLKTEESPLHFSASGSTGASAPALVHAEQAVLSQTELARAVMRYGYFYGPHTYATTIERSARQVPADGFYCFIHVEDAAAATVAVLEAQPGIYNVVDDTWQSGRRPSVSNEKLKRATGWEPRYSGLRVDWVREPPRP